VCVCVCVCECVNMAVKKTNATRTHLQNGSDLCREIAQTDARRAPQAGARQALCRMRES
jgi:hypothetical protein